MNLYPTLKVQGLIKSEVKNTKLWVDLLFIQIRGDK